MEGSDELEDIFDSAICSIYTSYNVTGKHNELELATSGKLDKLPQIHPDFEIVTHQIGREQVASMNIKGDTALHITQYYNAFQKNNEWIGAHTHKDTIAEFRLVMDFSAVETANKELFQIGREPKAYLVKHNGNDKKQVSFDGRERRSFP